MIQPIGCEHARLVHRAGLTGAHSLDRQLPERMVPPWFTGHRDIGERELLGAYIRQHLGGDSLATAITTFHRDEIHGRASCLQ